MGVDSMADEIATAGTATWRLPDTRSGTGTARPDGGAARRREHRLDGRPVGQWSRGAGSSGGETGAQGAGSRRTASAMVQPSELVAALSTTFAPGLSE